VTLARRPVIARAEARVTSDPPAEVVWHGGVTLFEALEVYADRELWTEYEALRALLMPTLPPEDLIDELLKLADPATAELPADPGLWKGQFERLDAAVKEGVIRQLAAGELLAIGYVRPRRRRDKPIWIPPPEWKHGNVSWQKSELWVGGSGLQDVRVIPSPSATARALVATLAAPSPPRRAGPPSYQEQIVRAYETLCAEGEIEWSSLKSNVERIAKLARLLLENPNARGFTRETIRKAIGERFARDQDAELAKNPSRKPINK
jgi:hypothetical protein